MIVIATSVALAILGLSVAVCIVRVVLGPTLADRILALDTMTVLGVGIIAVFAVRSGLFVYVDLAVALALVAFLSTVAFARYLFSRAGHD